MSGSRLGGGLVGLFVDRPVLSMMTGVAILAIGVLSLSRLPLRLVPEGISAEAINLYVPIRQDMPPREVEERVVRPLEELLRTIPGVKQIDASASSGGARVTVELDPGIDPVLASAEVRDRTQRARLQWPSEVDRYMTWREDPSSAPLAFFQIQTPEYSADWDYKLDQLVTPRLEAVDGVGRIDIFGVQDETLRIWFDRDKLREHRLDYGQILRDLQQDNFTQPVGEVANDSERFLVRVDSKFETREEIERYPIRTGLTVGDVARVEMVPSVRDRLARFDRRFTYTAILRLASGVNPIDGSKQVREAMEELKRDPRLEGLEFRFLFDQGQLIEDSLQTLLETSLQGGLLSLLVLWLFLRNLRLTVCIAFTIPMTLMISAGYMFFVGQSLNILTMAGLTLAVGMVVDNSVVVLENIRRRRIEGQELREASINGTREVMLAITMATLTTVVVILPLIFMGSNSNVRELLSALGMPLSIALLGSLGVALLLLPAAMRQVGTGAKGARDGFQEGRFSPIGALTRVNHRILSWSMSSLWRRAATAGVAVAMLSSMGQALKGLESDGGDGGGPFRGGDVTVNLEMPRGKTLREVLSDVESYEDFLFDRAEEWGIEHVAVRFGRTSARFDIMFPEGATKDELDEIRPVILDAWPRRPGVKTTMRNNSGGGMQGAGATEATKSKNFVLRLWGPDSEYLAAKALDLRDRLADLPEVAKVEVGDAEGNDQVVVRINRDRLSDLEVAPESLERTVGAGLRGMELTRFEEDSREIRLIAQFDSEEIPALFDLKETEVFANTGSFQRLDAMSDIRFERALGSISRRDGKTHVSILGERTAETSSKDMNAVLRNVMETTTLPRGYSWSTDSMNRDIQLQLGELMDAGVLSVILVFLLMGILFESIILPASILITIPFALFGAFWSLNLFHGSIDVMAGIGMMLLAGVVVNNGIVLLDCIERFRREGMRRTEAIVEGAKLRLRPIVMTAATTIFGLLPMAVFGESTGQGISYVSMSIAVAGGLAFCTVFTALVVPLTYTFADDFAMWLRGARKRAQRLTN